MHQVTNCITLYGTGFHFFWNYLSMWYSFHRVIWPEERAKLIPWTYCYHNQKVCHKLQYFFSSMHFLDFVGGISLPLRRKQSRCCTISMANFLNLLINLTVSSVVTGVQLFPTSPNIRRVARHFATVGAVNMGSRSFVPIHKPIAPLSAKNDTLKNSLPVQYIL